MRSPTWLLLLAGCAACGGTPAPAERSAPVDVIPAHETAGGSDALAAKVFARAQALQRTDLESAWRNLEACLDVTPDAPAALDLRGVLAWARGKPEVMRESWARVQGHSEAAAWAHLHRALAGALSAMPEADVAGDLAWLATHGSATPVAPLAHALQAAVHGEWDTMHRALNAGDAPAGWELWALRAHYDESRPGGDWSAAASAWDEAWAAGPALGCILAGRARGQDRREPGSGRDDWDAAIRSENWRAGHRASRGLSRLRAGDLDGAQTDLDWAIRLDPTNLGSYRARGVLWRARDDLPKALADIETVLRLAPTDRDARIARAELLAQLHQLDAALQAWNALITENGADVAAIAGRGQVYAALGNAAAARADILRALELDPDDPAARMVRAGFRIAAGEFAAAAADLDFAIAAGAGGGAAYARRARVRLQLDDRRGARGDVDEAIRQGVITAWIFFTRARLRVDEGDLPGASADLDRAVQIDPRNAEAHVARGELAHARGMLPEALQSYDRAVQLDPKNKLLRARRGFVRADAGERRGAISDLEFAAGDDNAASIADRDLRITIRTRLAEIRVAEARKGR